MSLDLMSCGSSAIQCVWSCSAQYLIFIGLTVLPGSSLDSTVSSCLQAYGFGSSCSLALCSVSCSDILPRVSHA